MDIHYKIRRESPGPSRREVLRETGCAMTMLAASALCKPAAAQTRAGDSRYRQIPSWNTELHKLAPNVYAYTQATGPGVDNGSLSNAGVIVGADMLAIDTLGPPVHAKAFRAAAEKATGKRFGRVVNTHHHRDHTNGNCFFPGAEIVAHEYCREAVIEQGIPDHPYDNRSQ